jgi:hypothetical protein
MVTNPFGVILFVLFGTATTLFALVHPIPELYMQGSFLEVVQDLAAAFRTYIEFLGNIIILISINIDILSPLQLEYLYFFLQEIINIQADIYVQLNN